MEGYIKRVSVRHSLTANGGIPPKSRILAEHNLSVRTIPTAKRFENLEQIFLQLSGFNSQTLQYLIRRAMILDIVDVKYHLLIEGGM